nr:MAG TPA: hypothetical protein [Caudoviricetes sp.]
MKSDFIPLLYSQLKTFPVPPQESELILGVGIDVYFFNAVALIFPLL